MTEKTKISEFLSSYDPGVSKELTLSKMTIEPSDYPKIFEFIKNNSILTLFFNEVEFNPETFREKLFVYKDLDLETIGFTGIPLRNKLNFLPTITQKCPKLSTIILQDCDLQENDSKNLCEILKTSKIKVLDISSNSFSNLSVNELLIALQSNTEILKLILENNTKTLNPDILRDIQRVLSRNRAVHDPQASPDPQEKENFSLEAAERTVKNLKRVAERELEVARVRQKDKEAEMDQLREIKKANEGHKKEVLLRYNAILEENTLFKAENQALIQEFQLNQRKNRGAGRGLEMRDKEEIERTRLGLIQREELEFKDKEQDRTVFELEQQYIGEYQRMNEFYRALEERKRDLERHVIDLKENALVMGMKFEDELRELENRIAQEGVKSFQNSEKTRYDEWLALKNDHKFNKLRHKELKHEVKKKGERNDEKVSGLKDEIYHEKARINKAHHNLSELNLQIENVKLQILSTEDRLERLVRMSFELKRQLEIEGEELKFDLRREDDIFRGEEDLFREGKEVLLGKIVGLEEAVARKRDENRRIKEEYQRVSGEVNGNMNRVLRDVVNGRPF